MLLASDHTLPGLMEDRYSNFILHNCGIGLNLVFSQLVRSKFGCTVYVALFHSQATPRFCLTAVENLSLQLQKQMWRIFSTTAR